MSHDELSYEGELTFQLLENKCKEHLDIPRVDINILKSFGLYKNQKYNYAAALLADEQRDHAIGLNIIRYHDESLTLIDDRVTLEGVSIIKHFDKSMFFFNRYIRTKDLILNERRITYREVPLIAFREALINAIIHRDYSKKASNRIEFFENRIDILSVGGLPVGTSEEEYINGSFSNLRNPILADIFYRLGYIEKMGTGIRRIKQSYSSYHEKPVFNIMKNSILISLPYVQLPGLRESGKPLDDLYQKLDEEEKRLVELFRIEGQMTRKDVEKRMDTGKTKAVKLLNKLVNKQLIYKQGKGRAVRYRIK